MNDDRQTLAAALRAAAHELKAKAPPPATWAAVRAAFERARTPRRPPRLAAWSGAAVCATLLLGSALLLLNPPPESAATKAGWASGFVPVAPLERWGDAGVDGPAWLVSTELPRERLAELGLPYDPARAGERVRAELLLHPSGEVLAVRFLR